MRVLVFSLVVALVAATSANAAVVSTTGHGAAGNSLDGSLAASDLISGLIGTELAGDLGWHPANPAAGNSLLPEGLPAFTNDSGESGLAGLLNDFPPVGAPTKRVQYDLAAASDVGLIKILTGNDGKDGRVFSTTVISASTDGGSNFAQVGYFESDLPGTVNAGQWGSTLVSVFDDSGAPLVSGATNLIFEFYAVDNTGGEYRDPFDGVNPFTSIDDGLNAAIASPLVWEIDVQVPEPTSALLMGLGVLGLLGRRRS